MGFRSEEQVRPGPWCRPFWPLVTTQWLHQLLCLLRADRPKCRRLTVSFIRFANFWISQHDVFSSEKQHVIRLIVAKQRGERYLVDGLSTTLVTGRECYICTYCSSPHAVCCCVLRSSIKTRCQPVLTQQTGTQMARQPSVAHQQTTDTPPPPPSPLFLP